MADRKPVTIHYRKFERPGGVVCSLEDLIRGALNALDVTQGKDVRVKERYISRLQTVGSDNLFINLCVDETGPSSYVMGDVLHFTKGRLQALFQTADPHAALVPVQQMQAPEQSEYVHSQMFWFVKGDHVFVIQSLSLQTEQLEAYFRWFLHTKTGSMLFDEPVVLATKFDKESVGGDLGDIQQIIVGGIASRLPAETSSSRETTKTTEKTTEVTEKNRINTAKSTKLSTARAILTQLLDGEANVDRLLRAVPEDAELKVQVHIGFETKKRKVDRVALRQLETGLRNLPDGQLEVVAKGKKVGVDGSVRMNYNASVKLIKSQVGDSQIIGSLLDPADVRRALVEAYDNFISNGKIK